MSGANDADSRNTPSAQRGFVGRERELRQLRSRFRAGARVGLITGPPRIGKTSLVRVFASLAQDIFPGGIAYINATPLLLPRLPTKVPSHHLTIIDDAHYLSAEALRDLKSNVARMDTTSLLLVDIPPSSWPGAFTIYLPALTMSELLLRFGNHLGGDSRDVTTYKTLEDARRDPYLLGSSGVQRKRQESPESDPANNLAFAYAGIVGIDGRPLTDNTLAQSPLILSVAEVNDQLLSVLDRQPTAWYELSPRKFEEVVAEILNREGYSVVLTPEGADGGFDIYAARKDSFGEFLFLVECKRYTPPHNVGVQIVRALRGVVDENRAVGAAVVTTSYFTRKAREYRSKFRHELNLHDFAKLQQWLREVRGH